MSDEAELPPHAPHPLDLPPPPPPGAHAVERVVLLGYMTSGKSTVGRALARRLEWTFVDFDVEIEARTGVTVPDLVAEGGMAALREREEQLTGELAGASHYVLAPGGGWITRPEWLASLGPGTFAVWLRVSPQETVRRLRADTIERPFREMDDPLEIIERMLAEREPLFRLADLSIPTDGRSVESIAYEIESVVRTRALAAFAPPPQA
jgi:shikimate kinase